jgi:hypothetical protein
MVAGELPTQQLPSLGALVERWCWLVEERVWTIATEGEWEVDLERFPREWYEQGLL